MLKAPPHIAAQYKRLEEIENLINSGADLNNVKDKTGQTLLHSLLGSLKARRFDEVGKREGLEQRKMDLIKIIIDKGVDLNAADQVGKTPLYKAIMGGHIDLAEYLIDKGVDLNTVNENGDSILHTALWRKKIDLVKRMLDKGADVNVKDGSGNPFLSGAIMNDHIDLAENLIGRGADVNAKDTYGNTPLHEVSMRGHSGLVDGLLDKGADINARNEYKDTPLLYALQHKHFELASSLIDYEADINCSNVYRETPLSLAQKNKHEDLVKKLQAKGAILAPKIELDSSFAGVARLDGLASAGAYTGVILDTSDIASFDVKLWDYYVNLARKHSVPCSEPTPFYWLKNVGDLAAALKGIPGSRGKDDTPKHDPDK